MVSIHCSQDYWGRGLLARMGQRRKEIKRKDVSIIKMVTGNRYKDNFAKNNLYFAHFSELTRNYAWLPLSCDIMSRECGLSHPFGH